MMNFAFWHMKHSAMVAAKSEIDMEEAKKVNKVLQLNKYETDPYFPK